MGARGAWQQGAHFWHTVLCHDAYTGASALRIFLALCALPAVFACLQELSGGGPGSGGPGSGLWQAAPSSSAAGTPPTAAAADAAGQAALLSVEQMLQGPPLLGAPLPRPLGTAPAGEEWFAGGMTDFSTRTGVAELATTEKPEGDQTATHWTMSGSMGAPGAAPGAVTWEPSAAQGQTSAEGGAAVPIRFAVRVWSPAV